MKSQTTKTLFAIISLTVSILACSFPSAKPQDIPTQQPIPTQETKPTETPSAPPTETSDPASGGPSCITCGSQQPRRRLRLFNISKQKKLGWR